MRNNIPKNIWKKPVYLLATGFGSGLSPIMPGTCGTIIAIPIYLLLNLLPWMYYLSILGVMIIAGFVICGIVERQTKIKDNPSIVWDEIVGYLLTMAFMPTSWRYIIIGFILFRIFDIWKPWPVSWVNDNMRGGFGVVIDDLLAAVYAGLLLQLIFYLCG